MPDPLAPTPTLAEQIAAVRFWIQHSEWIAKIFPDPDGIAGRQLPALRAAVARLEEDAAAAAPERASGWRDIATAREDRQTQVSAWITAAFGAEQATSVRQRGVRMLEEAIEAYQAAGCDGAMAHDLVAYVFGRPVGELGQELGGVAVGLLGLANAAGLSAEAEEVREVTRVLSKPLEYFAARNAEKNAAGFLAAAPPEQAP